MSLTPQLRLHIARPTLKASGSKNIHPGRHRSHNTIQMRCLQEGSDANGATIARPQWTGISPLDVNARETRRPQQGKQRPTASPSPKLSPKNPQAQMPGQEADPITIQHLQRRVSLLHGRPIRRASPLQLHAAAAKLRRPPPHSTRQHAETGTRNRTRHHRCPRAVLNSSPMLTLGAQNLLPIFCYFVCSISSRNFTRI